MRRAALLPWLASASLWLGTLGQTTPEPQPPAPWDFDATSEYGPHKWGDYYEFCNGKYQSPVAFFQEDVEVDHYIPILRAVNYDLPLRNLKMINSGNSVQIVLPARLLNGPKLNGGKLKGTYRLTKFKFHWGHFGNKGSEHAIGNTTFPMEMQLIHLKGNLTMEKALRTREGVAIVSVLFDVVQEDNKELQTIVEKLKNIRFMHNWVQLSNVFPRGLMPMDMSNFFSYKGSLTAPPCSPVVQWIVYANPAKVSSKQMKAFRKLFSKTKSEVADSSANSIEDKIIANARPLQAVNGRKIWMRRDLARLPARAGAGRRSAVFRLLALPLLAALAQL